MGPPATDPFAPARSHSAFAMAKMMCASNIPVCVRSGTGYDLWNGKYFGQSGLIISGDNRKEGGDECSCRGRSDGFNWGWY